MKKDISNVKREKAVDFEEFKSAVILNFADPIKRKIIGLELLGFILIYIIATLNVETWIKISASVIIALFIIYIQVKNYFKELRSDFPIDSLIEKALKDVLKKF